MRKTLWILAGGFLAVWLFRKPLTDWYSRRATGLQAVKDAITENGYTTYNTSLYIPPFWQPVLNFFKAGAYVPSVAGSANGQSIDYSMQG